MQIHSHNNHPETNTKHNTTTPHTPSDECDSSSTCFLVYREAVHFSIFPKKLTFLLLPGTANFYTTTNNSLVSTTTMEPTSDDQSHPDRLPFAAENPFRDSSNTEQTCYERPIKKKNLQVPNQIHPLPTTILLQMKLPSMVLLMTSLYLPMNATNSSMTSKR